MSIDVYQTCLCGSGQKIKFCCCKDITNDLGKVIEKLDSEQRVAALDQVNKIIERRGNRAALLAIKAIAELQLGNEDGAAQTVATFVEEHPKNCVALALTGAVKSGEEDPRSGIEPLQRALEQVSDMIPEAVYESIGAVAEALLAAGHVLAARAHYLLQAGLSAEKDDDVNEILARLGQSPQLSLLMKQTPQLDECPDDSPLKADFDAALDLAGKGMWLAASEKFAELAERAPDDPSLDRNLGILYCCLGKNDEAVTSFHRYAAANGDLNLDDKVEAEALAQLLEPLTDEEKIPILLRKHEVTDVDKLLELFEGDRRIDSVPVDTAQMGSEDSAPPKGVFYLLDRPTPDTGFVTQREEIPHVLGELFVYGRETDREPRLEVAFSETEDFDKKVAALAEVTGELVSESQESEEIGETMALESALTWNWRIPPAVPVDQREVFLAEQRREVILKNWPQAKMSSLGGKTPAEASDDPALQVQLLAAVWLLELTGDAQLWKVDFNDLRTELGLPTAEPIDPTDLDLVTVPLARLSRLAIDKLDDKQLLIAFQRAVVHQAYNATRTLAHEILQRDSLKTAVKRQLVYGALVKTAQDTRSALDYVHLAQQAAREQNESPAQWLVAELSIRIRRGEGGDFRKIMAELESKHMREQGIAQSVTQLMLRYGIISQADVEAATRKQAMQSPVEQLRRAKAAQAPGMPGLAGRMRPGPAAPTQPGPPPAATPAPADNGVWTPDSAAASDESGGEKPKIWTPGMD